MAAKFNFWSDMTFTKLKPIRDFLELYEKPNILKASLAMDRVYIPLDV